MGEKDGEARSTPCSDPIWIWGPGEARTWAQELGSSAGLSSTGTAFVLGRAAASKAAHAT